MNTTKNKFQGKYLLSDVDGTLMGHDEIIPQRNLAAIRAFCQEGGQLGLATGRSIRSARWIAQQIGANIPCILFNGAVIYDYACEQPIVVNQLPVAAVSRIKPLIQQLGSYRMIVSTLYKSYEVGAITDPATQHRSSLEEIPDDWIKLIFRVKPHEHDALVAYLQQQLGGQAAVVSSSSTYVEILPCGVSKGAALLKLVEIQGLDLKDIYVIGDYYNDQEMLKTAHHTACPVNAPDDIKAICQRVVCSVEQGAVAAYIEAIAL